MHFTQPRYPLFHCVQIVTDGPCLAHFPLAPFCSSPAVAGHRSGDTVFVDIQSKIEFFFH